MTERNSVLKQLKDGKLSQKFSAGGKVNILQEFVYSFNRDVYTVITCHCFGMYYIVS